MGASILFKWQQQWDNLSMRMNRTHGEVMFHMTQLQSGHGSFKLCLHRFGYVRSPIFSEFSCSRFADARGEMAAIVQANVDVENIVKRMFSNERKKKAVSRTVVQVMSAHQRD